MARRPRRRNALVHVTPKAARRGDDWWRGAVIYQVYPRSFLDTDGDGVGDLKGIAARLEHVERLGVDAVWISPFFKSPMRDFGYDVEDYTAVDPLFGTLADFDALLERAHGLGLKLLVDFVPSHTSDRHAWFQESRRSRDNPKADWYVWADPRPDGSPPNNWLSVFGGVAWEWEPRRGQYYLHNFLKEQPDLNFHCPAAVEALLDQAKFWLDRGVDGFRVDAIDFGAHDPKLRSNPPRPRSKRGNTADLAGSPFGMQLHRWNKGRPELVELFLKPLHALTEQYQGKVLLGEISGDDALLRAAEYTNGGGLDIVYTFDLLSCAGTPKAIAGVVKKLEAEIGDGWACWSLSNHDVRRAVTRFGGENPPEGLRRLIPVLLGSLRGTACLYQGEELGLEEADLAFDQLKDPYGIAFWPAYKGRDGARTPMPWRPRRPACRLCRQRGGALVAGAPEPRRPSRGRPGRRPGLGAQHHPRLPQLAARAEVAADRRHRVPARALGRRAGVPAHGRDRPAALPVQPGPEPPTLPRALTAARRGLRERGCEDRRARGQAAAVRLRLRAP
jgi:alpha-glucosidase